jgi:GNAT superfamily N-acetyltransferase
VGYALTSTMGATPYFSDTFFLDPQTKDEITSNPHVLLEQIAVKKDCRREGIGGILLRAVIKHVDGSFLSYVAKAPVDNSESSAFHERHGFVPIGTFRRDVFAGRKDYQSILYRFAHESDG